MTVQLVRHDDSSSSSVLRSLIVIVHEVIVVVDPMILLFSSALQFRSMCCIDVNISSNTGNIRNAEYNNIDSSAYTSIHVI